MNERGFTLTELLCVVAIVAMIMAGVFTLQQQGQWAYLLGAARVNAQQNARMALDRMISELRTAASVTAAAGCNNVANGCTSIAFVDQTGIATTYQLAGTDLQRTDNTGTQALIGGVEEIKIWCFQSDGVTLTATATEVASVLLRLRVRDETITAQPQHAIVESRVRLRNT